MRGATPSLRKIRIPGIWRASKPVALYTVPEHFQPKQLQGSASKFPETHLHAKATKKVADVANLLRQPQPSPRFPTLPICLEGRSWQIEMTYEISP